MNDFANVQPATTPPFVNTLGPQCPAIVAGANFSGSQPAAITWVANLAVFVPIILPWDYPVSRVFWTNGSTLGSNCDFGVYTDDGAKVFATGSVAQAGASVPQYVDPTDFTLVAGRYYFAFTCDGTTSRVRGFTVYTTAFLRQMGVYQQATIAPGSLPATMASVAAASQALYAVCGITRTPSGF